MAIPLNYAIGQLFMHRHGGVYRLLSVATDADRKSLVAVYEHVWPFDDRLVFVRDAAQFVERFEILDVEEFATVVASTPKEQAIEWIASSKKLLHKGVI